MKPKTVNYMDRLTRRVGVWIIRWAVSDRISAVPQCTADGVRAQDLPAKAVLFLVFPRFFQLGPFQVIEPVKAIYRVSILMHGHHGLVPRLLQVLIFAAIPASTHLLQKPCHSVQFSFLL